MSADGVVRFEFYLWTVSSVFITLFVCFCQWKGGCNPTFCILYATYIFILVLFGLLGCWLIDIGISFSKKFCFDLEIYVQFVGPML